MAVDDRTVDIDGSSTLRAPRRRHSIPEFNGRRPLWAIAIRGTAPNPTMTATRRPKKLQKSRRDPTPSQAVAESVPAVTTQPTILSNCQRTSFQSYSSSDSTAYIAPSIQRMSSTGSHIGSRSQRQSIDSFRQSPRLTPIPDDLPLPAKAMTTPVVVRSGGRVPVSRQSSLRIESRMSEEVSDDQPSLLPSLRKAPSQSERRRRSDLPRPFSHPFRSNERIRQYDGAASPTSTPPFGPVVEVGQRLDRMPSLTPSRESSNASLKGLGNKPRASFKRLSSLDNLISYREEKAEWKRASSIIQRAQSEPVIHDRYLHQAEMYGANIVRDHSVAEGEHDKRISVVDSTPGEKMPANKHNFRHFIAEVGFCFTIAMTQFLAEYLISGFALELPNLLYGRLDMGAGSMGIFWPAALLSLILSTTLLIFARLSDMYSGYPAFMFGVAWLAIWTLIPGFCRSTIVLDVSRAMQGLAIAAFTPSTFAMLGSIYPEGPRRNFVLGLYSGCAPLGFFAGFFVAGALPQDKAEWYFWIASILSLVTFITAFLTVPSDRTDRRTLGLDMDWVGAIAITAGLILVAYAFSIEPYVNELEPSRTGFSFAQVYGPLVSGSLCLAFAFWYEGWCAKCPILPFDFFRPRSVKAFSLACLCFYASYGIWLYESAEYFQSHTGVTDSASSNSGLDGITLAMWYTPTAVGGLILCIVGGCLMHIVPIMILLLLSAVAWIGAPLLLALAPLPLDYWPFVMPSMLCATIGIDLTFTVSIVFFSSVQPLRYQGLAGAICSSLVNLAMSFALSIAEIVMKKARQAEEKSAGPNPSQAQLDAATNWGYRACFIYGAASATVGLVICVLCVRISRSVVSQRPASSPDARPRATDSDSTLVADAEGNHGQHRGQEEV